MNIPPPLDESWAQVVRWLATHAPLSHASLNPPADPSVVLAAERELGMPFLPELAELLSHNDGTSEDHWRSAGFLPGGHALLSVAGIVDTYRRLAPAADDEDEPMWFHLQWVPVAWGITGDGVIIDQRPGATQGRVGEYLKYDGVDFASRGQASLGRLLADLAVALETQTAIGHYHPVVIDGVLDWDI